MLTFCRLHNRTSYKRGPELFHLLVLSASLLCIPQFYIPVHIIHKRKWSSISRFVEKAREETVHWKCSYLTKRIFCPWKTQWSFLQGKRIICALKQLLSCFHILAIVKSFLLHLLGWHWLIRLYIWVLGAHFRTCIIEIYTCNLYNLINQCHSNKFNKIKLKDYIGLKCIILWHIICILLMCPPRKVKSFSITVFLTLCTLPTPAFPLVTTKLLSVLWIFIAC